MVTQTKASMQLLVLGATGGIGRALVDQAIERGHEVTAFVRSPEKLGPPRDGLSVRKGDPRSVDELRDQGFLFWLLRKTLLRNIAADSAEMERVVVASGLDWTIIRPPSLTNGRLSGRYGIEDDRMPPGGMFVSRADVAQFVLDELERGAHVRRMVGIASARVALGTLHPRPR